jgi:beta-ribofuranosylaminobenzene 5'-phosphate synthase
MPTQVIASRASATVARVHPRAAQCATRLEAALSKRFPADIAVTAEPIAHAGLGSGTQLSIATAVALTTLHGQALSPRAASGILERGKRSGIGIASFEQGGFIVDGGSGTAQQPPPLIARLAFPESWRVILIIDRSAQGLHGEAELAAFAALPPFPLASAQAMAHHVLTELMPALVESDLPTFGCALAHIQATVGDHFAPAQGGRYTSPRVADALAWLASAGVQGIGQSSWGPTGFAIVGSESDAQSLLARARQKWTLQDGLEFLMTTGRNRGALMTTNQTTASVLSAPHSQFA